MLYAIMCEDKADSETLRKATRDAHLSYIDGFEVRLAGPLLSPDGSTMIGSLILLEADSLDAAEAFAGRDPYRLADLFERVTIRPFRQVIPSSANS